LQRYHKECFFVLLYVAELWTAKDGKLRSLTIYFDTLTFANNIKIKSPVKNAGSDSFLGMVFSASSVLLFNYFIN
jgi:hypothetical protein